MPYQPLQYFNRGQVASALAPFIYVLPEMVDTQPGHSYVGGILLSMIRAS
jgi:hypothetical protein